MSSTRRQHFDHVDSTQRVAIDLARAGAPAGSVVVADRQDAGIGRLDHRWISPPGGLYLSTLLPALPEGGPLVPLAVGTAISAALRPFSAEPKLKWPNDLVVVNPPRPSRKLGGVLVDRVHGQDGRPFLVVGVGVNVAARPDAYPADLRPRIVQLTELAGRPVGVEEVERVVVPAISAGVRLLETESGRAEVVGRLRARLYGRGQRVRVDGASAGVLEEVDDDGALVVAEGDRRQRILAGEVVVEDR